MNSRDIIRQLKDDGWVLKRITGSHHHFMHPMKPGIVTLPHPKRDLPRGTLRSIERQTGSGRPGSDSGKEAHHATLLRDHPQG